MTESTFSETTPFTNESNGQPTGGRTQVRTLYRHPGVKVLGGVCGGIADYMGWSEAVVRLLWIFVAFATSGAGFFVYLLLWLVLPVGTQAAGHTRQPALNLGVSTGKPLAFLLMGLGVLWLLGNLGILPALSALVFTVLNFAFWPALLIFIGWKILRAVGGNDLHTQMDGWRTNVSTWAAGASAQMSQTGEQAADTVQDAAQRMRSANAADKSAGSLYRSSSNRIFLGVCGGIAERYGVDATLVRLLWAMLAIASLGLGAVAYVLAAMLLPEQSAHKPATSPAAPLDPNAVQEIAISDEETVHF